MSPRRADTIVCREPGCGTRIKFATSATTGRRIPIEARDRPPFSDEAVGSLVIVGGQAWRPADLIEHFMTRSASTESAARDLVEGFPFHRPHTHPKE